MSDLLNVDWAIAKILEKVKHLPAEEVQLLAAYDRVLANDITSTVDLPPFDNSAMDGYAVRAEDTKNAPVTLDVVMDIPAGHAPEGELKPGQAARIMTGAPIPRGADAVVPVEDTDSKWDQSGDAPLASKVTVNRGVSVGAAVRPIGENVKKGQQILNAGIQLRPQDIGMLASIGVPKVNVYRQPRVTLLTTGDELIAPDEPLTPGKIRDSNTFTLAGLVLQNGGIPLVLPKANDVLEDVRKLFRDAIAQKPDVIISTAGVSVGTVDFVRTVLEELGEVNFWKINLRPGKPLAFGQIQGIPFFGLPGNPVSAMVTFDVVVRPALMKMLGLKDDPTTVTATLAEDTQSDGRRSYLRVNLRPYAKGLMATTTGTQSSGALMSMVLADGLMIIPEGVKHVSAGTEVEVRLLRNHNFTKDT